MIRYCQNICFPLHLLVSSSATKGCFTVFVALTKQAQPQMSSFSSNLNDEDDNFAVLVAFTTFLRINKMEDVKIPGFQKKLI
uniref:Uncharacterized protein n=1 Tax=Meloidogyne enterolobii TaxID=390850 RepID=A0A6V7WMJ3_MELEN|nr:unnamed protein product [Meloidogyne enterolobii]